MQKSTSLERTRLYRTKFIRWIPNLLLTVLSLAVGLGVLEVVFRLNPRLISSDIPTYPPARRFTPSQNIWLDVRRSDGDLFTRMQGKIRPLDPSEDRLLTRVNLMTDHLGFRNAEPWRAQYNVVALGDSFTYGTAAPVSWPERLAQLTNKSVLNLGWEGIGPMEERDLFLAYGRDRAPQWTIVAFFEGNDLNDAASYSRADPLLVPRIGKFYLRQLAQVLIPTNNAAKPAVAAPTSDYTYPVRIRLGAEDLDATFFDFYLSWLSANASDIAASRNLRLTAEAFRNISSALKGGDSHLLIVYVPSKERLLAPVLDGATLVRVFQTVRAIHLESNGYLNQGSDSVTPANVMASTDDQKNAIEALARETSADFLDLTPCFRSKMQQGLRPYYEFDTHWDQTGHDLAAQLIADYITKSQIDCP